MKESRPAALANLACAPLEAGHEADSQVRASSGAHLPRYPGPLVTGARGVLLHGGGCAMRRGVRACAAVPGLVRVRTSATLSARSRPCPLRPSPTGAWSYDAAGNQTRNAITGQASTYGERGQTTVQEGSQQIHFGDGNERTWQMGARNFALSSLGTTAHLEGAALVRTLRTPDGKVLGAASNVGNEYYVTDHLGSVIGRFDQNGAWKGGTTYDPFGQTRFTSGTTIAPWAYIGGLQQATDTYKLGARYYTTTTGRFTQMDPTGQEPNPYLYAAGNPCTNTDPTGTMSCSALWAHAGFIYTAGVTLGLPSGGLSMVAGIGGAAFFSFGALYAC